MQKQKRFEELEGLRGIAAVAVAIYHFLLAFYLFAFFGGHYTGAQHMRFEDNFYGSPFAVFFSGTFAVAIFFVLSGFVLSIGFFTSKNTRVIKALAAKRYLRLMLPALASTIICFIIIIAGSLKIQTVASITGSSWLESAWNFTPNIFDALQSATYDIFTKGGSPFNNVLWTMKTEFIGSFLIFGFLMLFGSLRYRWIGYIVLFVGTFNTWLFAFVAGMAIADAYAMKLFVTQRRSLLPVVLLVAASLYLGGYPVFGAGHTYFYGYFSALGIELNWLVVSLSFGAIGLLAAVLWAEQLAKFFAHKWLSGLGKFTFSLYLVHLPVIYTVGMVSFLLAYNTFGLGYNIAAITSFIVCVPVVIGATLLFERYVDTPSVVFSSKVARIFLSEAPVPVPITRLGVALRTRVTSIRAFPKRFTTPRFDADEPV